MLLYVYVITADHNRPVWCLKLSAEVH